MQQTLRMYLRILMTPDELVYLEQFINWAEIPVSIKKEENEVYCFFLLNQDHLNFLNYIIAFRHFINIEWINTPPNKQTPNHGYWEKVLELKGKMKVS
ncbi:MAG: hypothetical protein SFU99_18575 [Saprospiraceae bacterium]|nr:hypothetical protein [Saprospiraceae bacterium]